MASISRSLPRSGGKILRPRRTAAVNTPYDRPNSASRTPNLLSRFVFSPTRSIATGAGNLFLSVLDLQSSPISSSSSSFSDDSVTEETGTFSNENNSPFQIDDALKKSGTSEVNNFSEKELQPLFENSKSKHVIEHLLMQETFSREECDNLIKIIKSRVVDCPANQVERGKRPNTYTPNLSSAAVMEARKWLKERKLGLGSKSDLGYGSHSLDLVTVPQTLEDEGSLVDVAKSYMRARPPWASPSKDHINPSTPLGIQLFKEKAPHLISKNSILSPKLKRKSPATGSWSIQDELRRVRSRATEQMLMNVPSSKIDWSAFAAAENAEATPGEEVHDFTGSVDASSNLTQGLSTQAPLDSTRKQDGLCSEAVLSDPANTSEQNVVTEGNLGSQDDCGDISTSGQQLRAGY